MASIRMSNELREKMYAEACSNFELTNKVPNFNNETTIKIEGILRNSKLQTDLKEIYDKTQISGLAIAHSFGCNGKKNAMVVRKEYEDIWLKGDVLEVNPNGPSSTTTS